MLLYRKSLFGFQQQRPQWKIVFEIMWLFRPEQPPKLDSSPADTMSVWNVLAYPSLCRKDEPSRALGHPPVLIILHSKPALNSFSISTAEEKINQYQYLNIPYIFQHYSDSGTVNLKHTCTHIFGKHTSYLESHIWTHCCRKGITCMSAFCYLHSFKNKSK